MLVFSCRLAPGAIPRCIEVGDLAWVARAELDRFDVLAADRPLIERLQRDGPRRI